MSQKQEPGARFYILLSIGAALLTMGIKYVGYLLTGSVGLFSDALESLVNLAAALIGLWALTLAQRPADEEHSYGHTKAEYFASASEGALIIIAAIWVIIEAIPRLLHPQPLENIGLGLGIVSIAAIINGLLGWFMLRAGKRMRSITLEADARHLLTDVWTTVGVLVGVLLVSLTGWYIIDPIIALLVAVNIIWAGVRLLRTTGLGLLDTALPADERKQIQDILTTYQQQGLAFHALRTRIAGSRRFIEVHVLVPGSWSVRRGHDLSEEIEQKIRAILPSSTILTHLEPREKAVSWADQELDREEKQ